MLFTSTSPFSLPSYFTVVFLKLSANNSICRISFRQIIGFVATLDKVRRVGKMKGVDTNRNKTKTETQMKPEECLKFCKVVATFE